jgi:hypothetical protein
MNKHFFDVGAHDGDTLDFFLDHNIVYHGWNVWCFEPSPQFISKLIEKSQSFGDKFKIKICPFGIGGKNTQLPLRITECDLCNSFYSDLDGPNIKKDIKYEVIGSIVSLSEFMKKFTTSSDEVVIKLDCEGAEFDILEDLLENQELLSRISTIYVEFHGYHQPEREKKRAELEKKFTELKKPLHEWKC